MERSPNAYYETASVLALIQSGVLVSDACKQASLSRATFYHRLNHTAGGMDELQAAKTQGRVARKRKRTPEGRQAMLERHSREPLFSEGKKSAILEKVRNGAHVVDAGLSVRWPEAFLRGVVTRGQERINAEDYGDEYAIFLQDLLSAGGEARSGASEKVLASEPLEWLLNSPQGATPNTARWSKHKTATIEKHEQIKIVTSWGRASDAPKLLPALPQNWQMTEENSEDIDE